MTAHEDTSAFLDVRSDLELRKQLESPARMDRKALLGSLNPQEKSEWFGKWLRLHFGPGKISVDEFLYYGLHEQARSAESCVRYVGKTAQARMHNACNEPTWFAVAHNKLLLQRLLEGSGLPVPGLRQALLKGRFEPWSETVPLTLDTLTHFLRSCGDFPLFCKPVEGIFSIGAMRVEGYQDGQLLISNQAPVPVADVLEYLSGIDDRGYLFQECLAPASEWVSCFGEYLPSVRVMVLMRDTGPEIHLATLKATDGTHDADNFWREGNMLAPVDVRNGRIGKFVLDRPGSVRKADAETASDFLNEAFDVPDWDDLCSVVTRAATLLPGIRTQGWDVAITDRGPVILELNFGGDLNLHQLAHQRGILDDTYVAHLQQCGYRGKLPKAIEEKP